MKVIKYSIKCHDQYGKLYYHFGCSPNDCWNWNSNGKNCAETVLCDICGSKICTKVSTNIITNHDEMTICPDCRKEHSDDLSEEQKNIEFQKRDYYWENALYRNKN